MGRRKKIVRKSSETRMKEISSLLAHKPAKTSEIAKAMNMHSSSVNTFLNKMVDAGEVIYQGEGGKGDPYVFSLAASDKKVKVGKKTTAMVKAKKAEIVETLRVTAEDLPADEVVIGACALALRKVEKRGTVTLRADSPVMGLLAFAVDAHIAADA